MLVGYVGGEMDTGYNNACDYLGSPNNVIRRPLGHPLPPGTQYEGRTHMKGFRTLLLTTAHMEPL